MAGFNPKQAITDMIDHFLIGAQGLLEVTNRDFHEIYTERNAIYGLIYGKPSNRMATLLNIDREILILFTSFRSQQARTVKTIKTLLSEASGRLEPTIVIVVHPDPVGNTKLKAWGRENGVSILPLYYSEERFPLSPEVFENILCKELFSFDPFDITGPVSDDNQFYGRRTEAQDISRQLQNGQIKATLGIRKIGKTSIINRVVETCRNYHECFIVVIDCSRDEVWSLNSSELMLSIATSLDIAKSMPERYCSLDPITTDIDIKDSVKKLTESIMTSNLPVIIVFDEIDYITPGSPTGKHWIDDFNVFWRNLRVIYQECSRIKRPFSLLLSGVSSKWFRVESINGIENAALAFIPEDYLSPLPRGATVAMIKSLSRVAGLQFDEITAEFIANTCCDVPFWVRKACSFLHRRIDIQSRPFKPESNMVKMHLDDFVQTEGAIIAQVAIQHLFRVYPELKTYCEKAYQSNYVELPKTYLSIMHKYGLLKMTHGKYELSGTMVKEGLALVFHEFTDESEIINIPSIIEVPDQAFIEQWADELALIGRRRNILEKRLRGIVLNFLRFDSLQDKTKQSPHEKILKKVEEKRKKHLESLSTDDLIEKLLWTELISIIEKDWILFERIFSDKTNLKLNAALINDRFDAHAKDVDDADLALYRRSLKWFEDKIASL